MSDLLTWISTHPLQAFFGYLIFMAAVQALPHPTPQSSGFYTWFYGFVNAVSINIKAAVQPRKVGAPEPAEDKALPPAA